MPKLFIDNQGSDDVDYAFMDVAGNPQFSSTSTVDEMDGSTSTDIYQHEPTGVISQGHLVATIKWPSNAFRDPVLVFYSLTESEHPTKVHLSTNHVRQSLTITTRGHSRAHWRRIPETDKLAVSHFFTNDAGSE